MEMTAKMILEMARNIISKPGNWCKNSAAYRKALPDNRFIPKGGLIPCSSQDSEACQWCAAGAIDKVLSFGAYLDTLYIRETTLRLLDKQCLDRSIVKFNDRKKTSHDQIIDVFDKAIANVESAKNNLN